MGVNDTLQQLSRASQVVAMLARYRKAGILAGLDLGDAVEPEAHTGAGDDAMAERFAADLEALGPAFVKLGQALSTRPDLVPAGWIAALERIQDDATPAPIGDIEALLGHELGVRAGKVFSAIDPEPMAAASLAQVHRAVLRDGRACLHNNAAERRMRPLALGRKNYLFAGSLEGGRRAAIIYTLVGTAELNGWDPQAYLRVLLDRIADHPINRIGELAPWNLRPDVT